MTGPESASPERPAAPAAPPPTPDAWYLAPTGRAEGPVPLSELRARCRDAAMRRDVPVRHVSWDDWRPAGDVEWLRDLFAGREDAPSPAAPSGASVGVAFRRAGARLVDLTLLAVLAGSIVWGLRPSLPGLGPSAGDDLSAFADPGSAPPIDAALPLLLLVAFVGIVGETLFLHVGRGRSPGKALFRLRVLRADGQPARGIVALRRTVAAWTIGLGLGAPLLSFLLPIVQFVRVLDVGRTHYDRLVGTSVDVGPLPLWRGALGTLVVLLLVVLLLNVLAAGAVAVGGAATGG